MSDIRKWLASLNLSGYAEAFEANRIDLDLLPSLDHELLKELGVIPIGDRLRILKSAADLGKASQEQEHVAAQPNGSAVRTEPGGARPSAAS